MVTKVRTAVHRYDGRVWHVLNNGGPSLRGGSVSTDNQSVTADYPDWDYRKLIAQGSNVCTEMSATRNGYVTDKVPVNLDKGMNVRIQNPGIVENAARMDYFVSYYTLVNGKPNRSSQRLYGSPWLSNLALPTADSDLLSQVDNQANMIFRSKAQKFLRLLQAGVAIGEIKEVIHLIRNPAMAIRGGLREYLNRLNSRGFRNSYRRSTRPSRLRMLSDSWLEVSFGWKPLISDVIGGAELASRLINNFRERKLIPAVAIGRKTTFGTDNITTSGGNLTFRRRKQVQTYEVVVVYRGLVSTEPEDTLFGFNGSVLGSAGLSLLDFIPTIYELIPFSFLVDYFTNIGGIIDSLCHFNTGHRWLNKTIVELKTSKWSDIECEHSFGANVIVEKEVRTPGSRVIKVSRTITRAPNVTLQLPSFELHLPFSNTQWINIAALASGLRDARRTLRV
jgi:hypothetical protein